MLRLLTRARSGPRGPSPPTLGTRTELLLNERGDINPGLHLRQLLVKRVLTHELLQREQRVALLPDLLLLLLQLDHVANKLRDDLLRASVAGVLPCAAGDLLNKSLHLGVFRRTGC